MSDGANFLHKVYLFKDLTPKELEHVTAIAKLEEHGPGDEIFSRGDEAHSLYVIGHGSVRIQHFAKDNEINVATLASGSHFGEMSFLDGERRSATVTVAERTNIYRIDYKDLSHVLSKDPAVAVKMYHAFAHFLCGRLRVTTTDLTFAREKNLRHF